ncbi:hypothetical protein EMIHUDRAFT_438932, partial [Emiliania huxleyi CCMP1516]|uniref:Uncharacterized protein n=2 Tax=Emiliania huxleyi TaxID=2903 RepID=A0A0D3I3J2_EMIH1
ALGEKCWRGQLARRRGEPRLGRCGVLRDRRGPWLRASPLPNTTPTLHRTSSWRASPTTRSRSQRCTRRRFGTTPTCCSRSAWSCGGSAEPEFYYDHEWPVTNGDLSRHCRDTAEPLPRYCRDTAEPLPRYCRATSKILPRHCPHPTPPRPTPPPLTHAHWALHSECRAGSCRLHVETRGTSLALAPPPRVCGEVYPTFPSLTSAPAPAGEAVRDLAI